ncbi:hypothetical protein B9Z55_005209 [Caenorhabditis nigoni]|uniref:Uncharacterized protein n=1 Tax=Caenorhabditis nigoni TaxID=1611254 RepID=A0A2G5UZV4_9PELO|nr:hypothetical protein B9Z55_005209 [Caenorhabditis nigoni]
MTTSINSVVTVFQNVFTNHGSTLLNGILIATTVGGQSLVRKLTFSCPCAYPLNMYHSLVFMFGPTAALLLIGITVNSTTWKLAHGFCFRVRDTRHSWKTTCVSWIEVLLQSSIAPIAWLFVVFLDGGYYRCYRSHEFCLTTDAILCKNETIFNSYALSSSFNRISDNGKYCPPCICAPNPTDASYLEAESQIYAWALLVITGVGAFLGNKKT